MAIELIGTSPISQRLKEMVDPLSLRLLADYPPGIHPVFVLGDPEEEVEDLTGFYGSLIDQVRGFVPELVRLTMEADLLVDEHDAILAPEFVYWASFHALMLIRELAPAEAAEPLLALLDTDDEALIEGLPEVYSRIGTEALPALWSHIRDTSLDFLHRGNCARLLGAVANELEGEAKANLIDEMVVCLDREERGLSADEEFVNASVVSALCDLHAEGVKESDTPATEDAVYQAITRGFDDDVIGDHFISREDVDIEFGVRGPWTDEEREANFTTPRVSLVCTACQRMRLYPITALYFDPNVAENMDPEQPMDGETGPVMIPDTITCPKCGAVDQYVLSSQGQQMIHMAMLMQVEAAKATKKDRDKRAPAHPYVRFVDFEGLGFGGHPKQAQRHFDALLQEASEKGTSLSADQYAAHGRLLIFLGRYEEAMEQLAEAVSQDADHAEALYSMARVLEKHDRLDEALVFWERAKDAAAQNKDMPRKLRQAIISESNTRISLSTQGTIPSRIGQTKLKPNAPCFCGSGKKYKKCCM